ncbi:glutamate--tRNA ligase [Phosphitispora fastidiosa]|uniref:glutamate--tRNA ligase n=1 Tax=Phosphitispora fastidiosa TaxID=2837202 RepID=UPI001E3B8BAC|nr:glutamate--tRNA ligase [Phosphitispora fastidiosa]MBU7007488.1 nondiscriminating glutamyl-tRNA synthetase [Phosphitispora fastidiosa]
MDNSVVVRFAPSPTGPLHIGGARSALFNWLLARKYGGRIIVRIEDTDLERSSTESEENILESLLWLGLDWDEGIKKGGEHGPYRQTERLNIYAEAAGKLLETGQAYYCYCTEEELEAERQACMAKGELPRYLGKCRSLSAEERNRLEAEGRKRVIRFRVPDDENVIVQDLVRGNVIFESNGIGDYVIVKSDGIPTYNFAVVLDDSLMGVTHVIRGEEHLSNTPRQLLLYNALGLKTPYFAHVSLILGKDRSKMSKRHGSTSIEAYRSKGYLPEALVNFLALLGWSPAGEEEIFTLEEMVEQFSLDRVAKNPAVFDIDKLNWLNGSYIRKTDVGRITDLAIPFLREAGYVTGEVTPDRYEWLKMMVLSVQEKLEYVAQVTEHTKIYFDDHVKMENEEAAAVLEEPEVQEVMRAFRQKITEAEELTPESAKGVLKALTKELKLGGKKVYMPLRVALTGQMHGPELFYIIPVLGRDRVLVRLAQIIGLKD